MRGIEACCRVPACYWGWARVRQERSALGYCLIYSILSIVRHKFFRLAKLPPIIIPTLIRSKQESWLEPSERVFYHIFRRLYYLSLIDGHEIHTSWTSSAKPVCHIRTRRERSWWIYNPKVSVVYTGLEHILFRSANAIADNMIHNTSFVVGNVSLRGRNSLASQCLPM